MKFTGMRLSDPRVKDVLLSDVSDADYLYFVDDETGVTFRIRIGVLRAAIGGGGGGGGAAITSPDASASVTALDDGQVVTTIDDVPVETVELAQRQLRHVLDSERTIEVSIGDTHNSAGLPISGLVEVLQPPGAPPIEYPTPPNPAYAYVLRVLGDASALGGAIDGQTLLTFYNGGAALQTLGRAGGGLVSGFSASGTGGSAGAFAENVNTTPRLRVLGQLYLQTNPTSGTPEAGSMLWIDSDHVVRIGDAPVPNALPKPGGTTTANGIVTGSGTAGDAVAVSTTVIADLVKRLGNVFTLSANTVLDDTHSGGIIFTDTSGGARQHTVPTTVSAGWNAIFVREGANTLKVVGDGTMLMKGPAAVANEVAIAVDDGGVSVLRRSATKCWCAGKIS